MCTTDMHVQELVCSADEDREAVLAYRNALENALDAPAAAHPVEGYGPDNMSMAQVGRLLGIDLIHYIEIYSRLSTTG